MSEFPTIEETSDGLASLFANSRREQSSKKSRKKVRKPGPIYVEVGEQVLAEMQEVRDILSLRLVETSDEWLQVFVYDRKRVEEYIESTQDPEFAQRFVEVPGEENVYPQYRMEG